jgi:hypothetical protein
METDGAPAPSEDSSMHPLLRRFAVLAPLAVAPAALAQSPGDLIDQTRRMQAVAGQQLEADVRTGMAEAAKLTDKAETIKRYKALLTRVEEDKNLPEDRRLAMKRTLDERIHLAETAVATEPVKTRTQFAEGAGPKPSATAPADEAKIKDGIATVATLNRQGKTAEAQKHAQDLLKKYPANVEVQVLNGINSTAEGIAAADAVRIEGEKRWALAMRDVDKSAQAPIGDIEFGPDWKKVSADRLKRYGMSEEDKAMLKALSAPITVELKSVKFQDAIDYFQTQMKRTIVIDKNALDEAQLNYDTSVSCNFKMPVATRTALHAMLNNVNLTYVIRDGVIHVTNAARAKDQMVTKSYYIGDLVTGMGMFSSPPQLGHPQDQVQLAQNVQVIIDMIQQSVDPQSWMGKGGMGVIGYNAPTQSLIIRQSAEVHNLLRGSLYK